VSETINTSQNRNLFGKVESQITFNGFKNPKPFLKWAGGKTQLLAEIEKRLPAEIKTDKFTYVEPFVGSGAVLFWMLNNFPNMEKAVINDVNSDLINTYKTIKSEPEKLIEVLKQFQNEFHALQPDEEKRKEYYYEKRDLYNTRNSENTFQRSYLF
jgi:DNA adenine methylase